MSKFGSCLGYVGFRLSWGHEVRRYDVRATQRGKRRHAHGQEAASQSRACAFRRRTVKPDQRKIGDDPRIASPSSVRPVRRNSSPVIATDPAVPGGSLVPAGLYCVGGAVAQADKRTIMESNDFIVTSRFRATSKRQSGVGISLRTLQ